MSQHSKPQKWKRNAFGEENPPQKGRHECECVSNASNDEVLEWGCALDERVAVLIGREISFSDELEGQDKYFRGCEYEDPEMRRTLKTHLATVVHQVSMLLCGLDQLG